MGVTTRGPVCCVPMTAPPCQISGGVPLAVSPLVLVAWLAVLPAQALTGVAPTMPEMCPTRVGVLGFETQALLACDELLALANADVPSTVRPAVPSAASVRVVARRQRQVTRPMTRRG